VRAGVDGGGSGGGGGASEEAFGASERASESEREREKLEPGERERAHGISVTLAACHKARRGAAAPQALGTTPLSRPGRTGLAPGTHAYTWFVALNFA
jgi:hypothetical protein